MRFSSLTRYATRALQLKNLHACPLCKVLVPAKQMRLHTLEMHVKVHRCDNCDEGFVTRDELEQHLHDTHFSSPLLPPSGSTEWSCQICGEVFYDKMVWELHMGMHAGVQMENGECENLIQNSAALDRHFQCDRGPSSSLVGVSGAGIMDGIDMASVAPSEDFDLMMQDNVGNLESDAMVTGNFNSHLPTAEMRVSRRSSEEGPEALRLPNTREDASTLHPLQLTPGMDPSPREDACDATHVGRPKCTNVKLHTYIPQLRMLLRFG